MLSWQVEFFIFSCDLLYHYFFTFHIELSFQVGWWTSLVQSLATLMVLGARRFVTIAQKMIQMTHFPLRRALGAWCRLQAAATASQHGSRCRAFQPESCPQTSGSSTFGRTMQGGGKGFFSHISCNFSSTLQISSKVCKKQPRFQPSRSHPEGRS